MKKESMGLYIQKNPLLHVSSAGSLLQPLTVNSANHGKEKISHITRLSPQGSSLIPVQSHFKVQP